MIDRFDFLFSVFASIIISIFIGILVGDFWSYNKTSKEYQEQAIKANCAEYNPKTGDFQWKQEER